MKSLEQFSALSTQEAMDINGGAGLDSLIAAGLILLSPVAASASASLLILSTGASTAVNTVAVGLAAFLSRVTLPTV